MSTLVLLLLQELLDDHLVLLLIRNVQVPGGLELFFLVAVYVMKFRDDLWRLRGEFVQRRSLYELGTVSLRIHSSPFMRQCRHLLMAE